MSFASAERSLAQKKRLHWSLHPFALVAYGWSSCSCFKPVASAGVVQGVQNNGLGSYCDTEALGGALGPLQNAKARSPSMIGIARSFVLNLKQGYLNDSAHVYLA